MTPAEKRDLAKALDLLPQCRDHALTAGERIPLEDYPLAHEWAELRPYLATKTTHEAWRRKRNAIAAALKAGGFQVQNVEIRALHFRAWRDYHGLKDTRQNLVLFMRDYTHAGVARSSDTCGTCAVDSPAFRSRWRRFAGQSIATVL